MGRAPAFLSDLGIVSSLGRGKQPVLSALMQPDGTGITERSDLLVDGRTAYVGQVGGDLPALPADLAGYDSRNAGLLIAAIEEIRESIDMALSRYGPAGIAVGLGTSTSGIAEGEDRKSTRLNSSH